MASKDFILHTRFLASLAEHMARSFKDLIPIVAKSFTNKGPNPTSTELYQRVLFYKTTRGSFYRFGNAAFFVEICSDLLDFQD